MEWRDIKGYEGFYKISEYGDVKSLERNVVYIKSGFEVHRKFPEKILKLSKNQVGNYIIVLTKDGISKTYILHNLIYENFFCEIQKDMNIKHIDENLENCHYSNLKLVKKVNSKYIPVVKKGKVGRPKKLKDEKPKLEKVKPINLDVFNIQYKDGKYIENNKLVYEIILSKGLGKPTENLKIMYWNLAKGLHNKLCKDYPMTYRNDILTDVFLHLIRRYRTFDEKKYTDAVSFQTEVAKRAFAEFYNRERFKTVNYMSRGKNRFISLSSIYGI